MRISDWSSDVCSSDLVEIKHEKGHDIVIVDIVDVVECGRANQPPPHAHRYKVKIDHIYHVFDRRFVTGREILVAGGKTPIEKYELEKRLHGGHYDSIGVEDRKSTRLNSSH